jgi:hypothetical protein
MTTSPAIATECLQPPYPIDSQDGQQVLRGLFRQAWAALPADALDRACAAMAADDEPTIDSSALSRAACSIAGGSPPPPRTGIRGCRRCPGAVSRLTIVPPPVLHRRTA